MLDQATVAKITSWANNQKATDYGNRRFGPTFTNRLRQELRSLAIDGQAVHGSWRKGYEITLPGGDIIGVGTVTKGSNLFCIYYRPSRQQYQPPTAEQVATWRRS